ncbi:MAG TPA: serine hydrolase domain-containing protein, partial [Pseudonocardiaceae bacterium]|nr:serine hydrolase domain-containing protein [Pseudonocardiaceae bacterium]
GHGHLGLAVGLVDGATVQTAGVGLTGGAPDTAVTADTSFEIGSVTKVFNGMLLADMVADGRITPETTLRELYPGTRFADPEVAGITLAELASHRAGLPVVAPDGLPGLLHAVRASWTGADPYRAKEADDLLAAAASVEIDGKGDYAYSNFGAALLGHALAHRAGTTYPELVRERILDPLGMSSTTLSGDAAPPPGYARPHHAGGQQVAPWLGTGHAPAGAGVWSTASDLVRLVTAVRDGTAPGSPAARPRWPAGDAGEQVGFAWHVTDYDGRQVTWHNGATGGSSSFVGFTGDRAVVLLGNTDRSVDATALRLLGVAVADDESVPPAQYPMLLLTLLLPPLAAVTMIGRGLRRRTAGFRPAPDRAVLLNATVTGALLLLVTWRAGLWQVVPPLLWTASTAAYLLGCALAVRRWRELSASRSRRAWRHQVALAFTCLLAGGYLAVLVATLSVLD